MPQARPAAASSGGVEKNPRRTSKSRNGCQTCKVKRLKCDETRPACDNCNKRGYDCPGYKKPLKWSTKYEVLQLDEPDNQKKVFHPSVEYHFSSIDPVSFGHVASSSTAENPHQGMDEDVQEDPEVISDQIVADSDIFNDLEVQGAFSVWDDKSSTYHQSTLPSWASDTGTEQVANDSGSMDQTVARRRSSSPGESEWRTLLRTYYRMASPALTRTLQNDSTCLVEHYFRDVCGLYAAFDSKLNPFRTVVARLWDNSSSIFYAIQSMAAAHLANYMPGMGVQGLRMQRKAYECLQHELQLAHVNQQIDDKLLLTVLLLGMSSPWHEANDLGMAHLNAARSLIYPRLLREDIVQTEEMVRNDQFFAEALIYWEMCVAFVHNDEVTPGRERTNNRTDYNEARTIGTKVMPHPWTGVGPRAQMIFAEVGRLVRNFRALSAPISYGVMVDQINPAEIIAAAADFEEELLAIRWPDLDDVVDVQDERTGKLDFIMVAEATRCAALLQIYRVFPTILHNRFLRLQGEHDAISGSSSQFFFPFCNRPLASSSEDHAAWLTSLARHILLDLIGTLSITSGTRPLQLLLVTTAATELRLSAVDISSPDSINTAVYDLDVVRARGIAMARLQELASRLPSKPVLPLIKLVREVWRRYDNLEDVFWLDVMHENGWQTVIG